MYYAMITGAALLFSLQFFFNSGYEKHTGSELSHALRFALYTSLFGMLVPIFLNRAKIEFSLFTLCVSLAVAVINISYSWCSVKALEKANVSFFSMFAMLGGMLLPFVYGVCFFGEPFGFLRVLCCVLVIASLVISAEKGKLEKGSLKYYLAVFVLNGMSGVVAKFHQSGIGNNTDSNSFMFWQKAVTVIVCVALIVIFRYGVKLAAKPMMFCVGYSVLCTVGNLMMLTALLHLPASLQYPLVTGGTIVFSNIIDLMRGEILTKRDVLSALVAFAAVILMAI